MNTKTAVVFLADGFEECEGLLVVDLLRRAEVKVITASIMGSTQITSSHGIVLQADALAEDVDYETADMIVLPGGYQGTMNLLQSAVVKEECCRAAAAGKFVAAICAAPMVLADAGLLEGKAATCHPSCEEKMGGASLAKAGVVMDEAAVAGVAVDDAGPAGASVDAIDPAGASGKIITGRGLGAAIPFALKLVETLTDPETAEGIAKAICYAEGDE